jgi:hypothetical protein
MIQFRCWFCNKYYAVKEGRVGEVLTCTCKRRLRVPKKSGGNCRARTAVDWLVETVVYGGAGALLGVGLGVVLLAQAGRFGGGTRFVGVWAAAVVIGGLGVLGFLAGLFGGERGVNWIGRMIRKHEDG